MVIVAIILSLACLTVLRKYVNTKHNPTCGLCYCGLCCLIATDIAKNIFTWQDMTNLYSLSQGLLESTLRELFSADVTLGNQNMLHLTFSCTKF